MMFLGKINCVQFKIGTNSYRICTTIQTQDCERFIFYPTEVWIAIQFAANQTLICTGNCTGPADGSLVWIMPLSVYARSFPVCEILDSVPGISATSEELGGPRIHAQDLQQRNNGG
jgi:hypothetical protein